MIVINDPGGVILQHTFQGMVYAKTGAFLKVVYCASACLGLIAQVPKDHICFMPSAWIGYHTSEQGVDGYEQTWTMRWERGRDWIARGYRPC